MENNKVFIFNPDCELAVANGGRFYMPSANVVKMAEDLAFLPAWLGGKGDRVLVKEKPDESFVKSVCEPLEMGCLPIREDELKGEPALRGEPWGWSPKMCHWLASRGMGEEWRPEQKEGYSRKIAREGLRRLTETLPEVEAGILPEICYTLGEIGERVREGAYLVKAPWSSSGKGLLALTNRVEPKEKEWLSGMLRRQGYLMLEKRLDKVKDFAMEFLAGPDGVEFIGWSAFRTGDKGEYRGNVVGPQQEIGQELLQWMDESRIALLKVTLSEMLTGLLPFYQGYFGVDMMIYRDIQGQFRLQPCVEINLRYNMGIVALFLSRNYLSASARGWFEINFYPGQGEALRAQRDLSEQAPVVYKNNRIESGYLNLTPVTEATHFVASVRCY